MGPKKARRSCNVNECRQINVTSWKDITPGMPLYLKYYGLWHAILVTETEPDDGYVEGIHYGWQGFLSTRTISEAVFQVNVSNGKVRRLLIPKHKMVAPEVAIMRARKKIGEQQFNMFTRRSSHFVTECVMI